MQTPAILLVMRQVLKLKRMLLLWGLERLLSSWG
jgi:hypothetical protein